MQVASLDDAAKKMISIFFPFQVLPSLASAPFAVA